MLRHWQGRELAFPPEPEVSSLVDCSLSADGKLKLCEALKGSAVTSLKCAAAPGCLLSCQCPLTCAYSLTIPTPPLARSIGRNNIRAKGASALAAVLKETKITELKCVSAPECSLSCQRPLARLLSHHPHTPPLARSLGVNDIGAEGASALAAILKTTQITNLECAAA